MRLSPTELIRVGKGAQEQFLEYAHYLPERSVQATVERHKLAAYAALEGLELTQPLSAEQVPGTSTLFEHHGFVVKELGSS